MRWVVVGGVVVLLVGYFYLRAYSGAGSLIPGTLTPAGAAPDPGPGVKTPPGAPPGIGSSPTVLTMVAPPSILTVDRTGRGHF